MSLIERIKRRILIRRVNKALGIKLYDWQIERIFNDGAAPAGGRCVGVTTANVLRLLLNPKLECAILAVPKRADRCIDQSEYFAKCARAAYIFGEDAVSPGRQQVFIQILKKTCRTLNRAHIKTNSLLIMMY